MPYVPSKVPPTETSDGGSIAAYLEDELQRFASSQLDDVQALEVRPAHAVPLRPREGMVVYADGTDWNPGGGEGLYTYTSAGRWRGAGLGFLVVTDFGATGNGTTDDTASIAAAIAATPSGGTLWFPPGIYRVVGSGSAVFTLTKAINILGMGSGFGGVGATLRLDAGASTTRDLFLITGVTNSVLRGLSFKNLDVDIVSGTGGQNVFHFDTTAGVTTGFAEVVIENVMMPSAVSAGGQSIFLNNGVGTNTNGGVFNFTVQKCFIGGGIQLLQSGDTIRVLDNIITGANPGVLGNQVTGAGQLLVVGNNITNSGGAIIVNNGIAPVIAFNEIESGVTTEANNALVDINGSVGTVSSAKIVNNQIQGIAGTPDCIRTANATGTFIDGNRLSTSGTNIVNTGSGTIIGLGNEFTGTRLSDSGSGTIDPTGAWVTYTSTFASTTGTATVIAKKKVVGKTVFVNIQVTFTSAVTGTFSVTLPLASLNNAAISGKEIAIGGLGAAGYVLATSSTMSVLSSAGGQFLTNGMIIILTGSYEAS